MSTSIRCPKCRSEQFTAQKRGFSGGKAVVGAALTGGIGALAGFHGSSKIDVHCLSCGHTWDPVEQTQREKAKTKATFQQLQMKRQRHTAKQERIWKKQFFESYESGNLDEAERIIREKLKLIRLIDNRGLDGSYKDLKRLNRISRIVKLLFIALFLSLVIWIVL